MLRSPLVRLYDSGVYLITNARVLVECSGFDSRKACKAVPLRGTETLYLLALRCLAVHTRIELVSCDRQSRIIAIILMHLNLGRFLRIALNARLAFVALASIGIY